MAFKHGFLCFVLLLVVPLLAVADPDVAPSHVVDILHRSSFPKGFVFASASSAYQYEGDAFRDGKGLSIFDNATHHFPEKFNNDNGDVAIDQYHRYKEDVAIMKKMGLDAYRFSIAWSRVLPNGKLSGGVNKKGIEYYNNLINELLANGIQPYVTLFHWDVPQALQEEYTGFESNKIVNDFQDYVDLCFKEFGDRVKHWITLNEPHSFTLIVDAFGIIPRDCSKKHDVRLDCLGDDSGTRMYIVGHNELLAHAAAVKVYKTKYQARQKGVIGITLDSFWYVPYSDSVADKKAAERMLDFGIGWFLHPLTYGDYPASMRALVKERLPKFTKAESSLIKGSFDFVGVNYYTARFAKDNPNAPGPTPHYSTDSRADTSMDRDGVLIGPANKESWQAQYPQGLHELLVYTKNKYKDPNIYITENGFVDIGGTKATLLNDTDRIRYHQQHLSSVLKATKAGVRMKGYFAWSLFDNFEWIFGYNYRFGLNFIDYDNNLTRITKLSAKWYQNFLKN
ncbi:cyanogenic beta-glucosidase-like isoform X2 [Momordica charantia]|uniref:Cyanogenic beta-glucosidase-like isoform X2 n=1 Tax=Momordica charantia TaxID=3673 RepID=A0A6J1DKP5_MOMCH|nr:cyanogenic beta-glucosidase-like isoform X2 [Momordica charantia]